MTYVIINGQMIVDGILIGAVWAAPDRQLTDFIGAPRTSLVGANESIYTRLDAAITTRLALIDLQAELNARLLTAIVMGNLDASVAGVGAAVLTRAVAGDAMALTPAERLVVQALILNDATPFAGASVDATISSRATPAQVAALLGNLDVAVSTRSTQAQILSDLTPFQGARIDEAISARKRLALGTRTAGQVAGLNLNGGVGTSGEAGADVITIGAAAVINIINSLKLRIGGCINGAIVTIKLFGDVNGVERKVYTQNFTVGTDEDSPWIIDSALWAYGQARVEMYRNNAGDVNVTVPYEYILG